jgi:hypothetical protein
MSGVTIAGNQQMPNLSGGIMVGNAGDGHVRISFLGIDGTLSYSPATPTNQDVVVTLSLSMTGLVLSPGWSSAGNRRTYTKTYTSNITGDVVLFQDLDGNTGSVVVNINWIDKVAPTCDVHYNPSTNTNQDVVASLINCSKVITGTLSHTFTANGSHTFTFRDTLGNTGTAAANVTWIDKTPIIPTISYSPNTNTNQDVISTISFNKTGVTITSVG